MIVIDASMAVNWLLAEDMAASTQHLYAQVLRDGSIGPAIFSIEVTNALRSSLRRKNVDLSTRDAALAALDRMGVKSDIEQPTLAEIVAISDRHDVTTYDASYVGLAKLHGLALATGDQAMARAARAEGIVVLP